jgi:glycosyltransferase involved in cell wall biosynthesis
VAIRALRELRPEVTLDVYGEGPMRERLQKEASDSNLAGRVSFYGRVLHPIKAAVTAAAIVVPSLWDEPFGYVTAESMAAGKAVIATATGASPELLDGERGWLVPPADPTALAKAVQHVLSSPEERQRRGQVARRFVLSKLHPTAVAQSYERIYRLAVQGR